MLNSRMRCLNSIEPDSVLPVVYLMSRDQRVHDNWALIHAQKVAMERSVPLAVVFVLAPSFLGATKRQYDFMLRGLEQIESELSKFHIPFFLLQGDILTELPKLVLRCSVGTVITDFSPLRIGREWRDSLARDLKVSFQEVDAHNIIPAWHASTKQEFGAYTFRPKVYNLLPKYLDSFDLLCEHPVRWNSEAPRTLWKDVRDSINVDVSVKEVTWLSSGEEEGQMKARTFLTDYLGDYNQSRNIPGRQGQSDISPYLHFGQLSAQRIVLDMQEIVMKTRGRDLFDSIDKRKNGSGGSDSVAAFFEELVVRRELSDNFCLYNQEYDSFNGFPDWAQKTLDDHRSDVRRYIYTYDELELGKTHDLAWNAAQLEMVKRGKMHGYMRMYWAKKILEWTESPEQALEYAIYLNDRYELDGRDPNGYTGIAWSIGGVHDRPWFDRPIFGKIRYMALSGLEKKFNLKDYLAYVEQL